MNQLGFLVLALVSLVTASGCTAGGVAVMGEFNALVPQRNVIVAFHKDCKSYETRTAHDGTFVLNGYDSNGNLDPETAVPPGMVFVTVKTGANSPVAAVYRFDHQYDLQCPTPNGGTEPCSKDLLLVPSSIPYNPNASNAPGPTVHVRQWGNLAVQTAYASYNTICNVH